jgi:glutathione peroxidase
VLVVNTASECGYTPQYAGLEKLYQKYKDRGFVIAAFPSNDFGKQEPGSDQEIKAFCERQYKTTFDLYSKIPVKGEAKDPLYKFLTSQPGATGEIEWNFTKFLVDKDGRVVARFPSKVTPEAPELTSKLESILPKK